MIDLEKAKETIQKALNICFIALKPIEWRYAGEKLTLTYTSFEDRTVTYAINPAGEFIIGLRVATVTSVGNSLRNMIDNFNRAEPRLRIKPYAKGAYTYIMLQYSGRLEAAWDAADPPAYFCNMTEYLFYNGKEGGGKYFQSILQLTGQKK